MAARRLALALACVALVAGPAAAQRLPETVVPGHYELRLVPDLQRGTIAGDETILVEVVKPTTKITLNAAGITFGDVTVVAGSVTRPASVTLDPLQQTATLAVKTPIPVGPALIHISYTAKLGTDPRGLYLGRANDRTYLASQFEATDARRAFPAFDEPALKASFSITAVIPAGDTAISNGRILSDTPGPAADQHTVKFTTTRKMSTYLVALAAGDFECLDGTGDLVPLRVCGVRGHRQLGAFALETAQVCLKFFNTYFSTRYPFTKLDLVALPDFNGGAMENTGAIFFRDRDLLVDAATSPVGRLKAIAATVSHEIAHQWVGDLVTMAWWNDLWLKEGLATWLETRPLAAWKPEWHLELDVLQATDDAMTLDAQPAVHPVRPRVSTPAEIDGIYDAIVYQKAAAILRMVESVVGEEDVRRGVNAYLKKYAYATATAEDFWTTMAETTGRPVDRIMRAFMDLPGVPLASWQTRCQSNGATGITVAQARFVASGPESGPGSPLWPIPVRPRPIVADDGVPGGPLRGLLGEREQVLEMPGCNPVVLANTAGLGYFRSSYAPGMVARLVKEGGSRLTPVERLRLLDDQWALTRAGRLDIGEYLALVPDYATQRSAQIVRRLGVTLRVIDQDVAPDASQEAFRAWVRRVFAPVAAALARDSPGADPGMTRKGPSGDDGEGATAWREVQAAVAGILGGVGHDPAVLAKARAAIAGGGETDAELFEVYLPLAAMGGDEAVFDRLTAAAERAESPAAQARALDALAHITVPSLLDRALDYALSGRMRVQDGAAMVATALASADTRPAAWAWAKAHWQGLVAAGAASAVGDAAGTFCDDGLRADVQAFFAGKTNAGSALAQSMDRMSACVRFKATQAPNLERWLASQR
jgi:aminopeptidase N/puromycin-sensitive aminopeptidase